MCSSDLDPQGTREIRHLIRELAADGTTIFLSSHLLAEIEQVCTHLAVMSSGRLVAQGSLNELQAATAPVLRVETDDLLQADAILAEAGLSSTIEGNKLTVVLGSLRPEDLCRRLVEGGVGVRGFVVERPSLEDTFVALTGEGFDVAQ